MSAAVKQDDDLGNKPRPWTADLPRLRDLVAAGMSIPTACDAVGLRWSRAKHWLAKGKRLEKPFDEFADAMLQATAAHDAACHTAIMGKMGQDWRAAAYMLDRRDAQRALEERSKGAGAGAEKTVLYYPVALPDGAAVDAPLPEDVPALPAHAFDAIGEPVEDDDEHEGGTYGDEDDDE